MWKFFNGMEATLKPYLGKKVKVRGCTGTVKSFALSKPTFTERLLFTVYVDVTLDTGEGEAIVPIKSLAEIKIIQEENKVDPARIDHLMDTATYDVQTVHDKCTVVVAKLENGFILTESSACVDPANYDAAMGERLCKDKIRERLWELEGYALQKSLYEREG